MTSRLVQIGQAAMRLWRPRSNDKMLWDVVSCFPEIQSAFSCGVLFPSSFCTIFLSDGLALVWKHRHLSARAWWNSVHSVLKLLMHLKCHQEHVGQYPNLKLYEVRGFPSFPIETRLYHIMHGHAYLHITITDMALNQGTTESLPAVLSVPRSGAKANCRPVPGLPIPSWRHVWGCLGWNVNLLDKEVMFHTCYVMLH